MVVSLLALTFVFSLISECDASVAVGQKSTAIGPNGFKKMKGELLRAERLSTDAEIAGFHAEAEEPSDSDLSRVSKMQPSQSQVDSSLAGDVSLKNADDDGSAIDVVQSSAANQTDSFDKLFKEAEASSGDTSHSSSASPSVPSDESIDKLLNQLNTSMNSETPGLGQASERDSASQADGVEDIDKILKSDSNKPMESLDQNLAELNNEGKDQASLESELKSLGPMPSNAYNSSGASLEEELKSLEVDDKSATAAPDASQSPEQAFKLSSSLLDNGETSASASGNWSIDKALAEIGGEGWQSDKDTMGSNSSWLDEELKKVDPTPNSSPDADRKWLDDTLKSYQKKEEEKSIAELAKRQLETGTADGV